MRDVNLAGNGALEAHERVSLLTVAAGLRPFCLLTHIREEEFGQIVSILPQFGLTCGVCNVNFTYDLDFDVPPEVLEAFRSYHAVRPLYGLGVAYSRIEFGDAPLGTVLSYPECCAKMDDATKRFDQSAALRQLIDSKAGDIASVIAELAQGKGAPTPHTDRREAWDRRFDRTHIVFPFAVHTACDRCLKRGTKSASGALSRRYESMVRAAAPDLYDAVLRQNEIFRQTSRFLHDDRGPL
jgi:hypothetical protein